MRSDRVVDLRKKKSGSHRILGRADMRPLALKDSTRRSSLRTRRRRGRLIVLTSLFALVAIGAYGISYASYLPRFSISRIDVRGADAIDPALVRSVVERELERNSLPFISGRNIFLYQREAIEMAIGEHFPRLESADLSRESLLATAVTVAVKERDAFARWCRPAQAGGEEDACFAMDSSGFVFAPASSAANFKTPYVFTGAFAASTSPVGQRYIPGRFSGILALLERLGQAGVEAEDVVLDGDQDFTVRLSRGFEILATFGADLGEVVKNLELVLSSEALRGKVDRLQYIDLRFGNRVYYKLFSEGESAFGGESE